MSSHPSPNTSPSNSPEPTHCSTSEDTATLNPRDTSKNSAEAPQPPAGLPFQPTSFNFAPVSSSSGPSASVISISEPASEPTSIPRQPRSLVARHVVRNSSSSQPPHSQRHLFPSPYSRFAILRRSRSQPRSVPTTAAMSSAGSSPASTSTAGASSGSSSSSNPTYQLPYAPFPYPMPPKGSSSGSNGSGK